MAVEVPSIEQQKLAQTNLSVCQSSIAENLTEMAANTLKQLQQTVDQTSQMMSQIPELAIGELNKVIELLMGLINGYINPQTPGFNITAIIAEIESLLKPVISALSALPIPKIPGLSQIVKLLNALKTLVMNTVAQTAALAAEGIDVVGNGIKSDTGNLGLDTTLGAASTGLKSIANTLRQDVVSSEVSSVSSDSEIDAWNTVSSFAADTASDAWNFTKNVGMTTWGFVTGAELPPEIKTMLQKLLCSIMSLCITLPLVLENLIFQMLNTIIDLFKQIAGIIGVPSIPFPLSLVPNCISMMPDLMNFIVNVPGKLINITTTALQDAWSVLTAQQMPKPPTPIIPPLKLPPCPKKANQVSANAGTTWLDGWGDAWDSAVSSSGLSNTASNAMSSTTNAFSNLLSSSGDAFSSSGEFISNSTIGLLEQTESAVASWFN